MLYYLPFTPRLKQLYEIKTIAKELYDHTDRKSTGGIMRDIYDGNMWKENYLDGGIFSDKLAVQLMISSNGYQPFHHTTKQSSYSIWGFQYAIPNFTPKLKILKLSQSIFWLQVDI